VTTGNYGIRTNAGSDDPDRVSYRAGVPDRKPEPWEPSADARPYLTLTAGDATVELWAAADGVKVVAAFDEPRKRLVAPCRGHADAIVLAHRWRDELAAGKRPSHVISD
jgi:hypothetical protein